MSTARWVCLMYHDVAETVAGVQGGPAHFSVSRRAFADQLDLVAREGLAGLSIEAALVSVQPRVAISFDDGDEGQYRNGFPLLAERGMSATFFITTSWVGRPGYVTWEQLREMRAAGMSIQSHTHSHPFLSELSESQLREELHMAKRTLDDGLGQDTTSLAFPGGDAPRRRLLHVAGELGYRVLATSRWGLNVAGHRGPAGMEWIRRCTVRGEPAEDWVRRVVHGDRWLGVSRMARESVLHHVRARLGPTRYSRWRRSLLDALGRR